MWQATILSGRIPSNSTRRPFGSVIHGKSTTIHLGAISEIRIFGDFLALLPISDLEEIIEGCAYEENALIAALSDINLAPYLGIITLQELVDTICNK